MTDKKQSFTENDGSEDLLFKTHRDLEAIEQRESERISKAISNSNTGLVGSVVGEVPSNWLLPVVFVGLGLLALIPIISILIKLNNLICWGICGILLLAIIPMFLLTKKQGKDTTTKLDLGE